MMKPGILTACIAAMVTLAVWPGSAQGESAAVPRPVVALPSFGEPRIDGAIGRLAGMTELAVVQAERLTALAARKQEAGETETEKRERLYWGVMELLYSDQVEPFQRAYEQGLPRDEAEVRRLARERMHTLLGRMEVSSVLQWRVLSALIECYRVDYPSVVALDETRKAETPEALAEKDDRNKREALLAPLRAKTYSVARTLLTPEKQKLMDDEWKRRQERRISLTQKDLAPEFAPRTDEQRQKAEAATAAFRTAAKDLDLESPEYGACVDRFRRELDGALNAVNDASRQPAGATKGTP